MATFTSNYWVTGETITADKLNGNWGGLITYNKDEGIPEEGINIGTGLGVGELMNLRFCAISTGGIATGKDTQGTTFTAYRYYRINDIDYSPDINKYYMYWLSDKLIYDPITGILSKYSSGTTPK